MTKPNNASQASLEEMTPPAQPNAAFETEHQKWERLAERKMTVEEVAKIAACACESRENETIKAKYPMGFPLPAQPKASQGGPAMSTPTQTPAEMAAQEIANQSLDFDQSHAEKVIQRTLDAEKKALIGSICEGLDLETLTIHCASERDSLSDINLPGGANLYSQLHTLVSRAKRAKEGKGV